MKWLKAVTGAILLAAFSLGAVGCHTVKGAGQDVSSTGKAISHSAQKTQEEMKK